MCEIQLIQKLGDEKINRVDIGEFFKMMCFGSMGNSDAFGVFNNKTMFKTKGAFDASKLDEYELTSDNFLVGHNRFSTGWCQIGKSGMFSNKTERIASALKMSKSTRRNPIKWNWSISWQDNMSNIFLPTQGWGRINIDDEEPESKSDKTNTKKIITYNGNDKNRNHHPFKLGDFTLVHNGTISNAHILHNEYNFQTTIRTDSYVILELIDYFFKKSRIKDRIRRISKAIQDTCDRLDGKYSVILYDKRGKNKFYFKNAFASFSICKYGDDILCGSTSHENLDYIYFGMEKEEIEIEDKRVYLITSDKKCPVIDVTFNRSRESTEEKSYNILSHRKYNMNKYKMLENLLNSKLGFIPHYDFTFMGDLKISRNNSEGIKEKIYNISDNPKKRLGWYIISKPEIDILIDDMNKGVNKKLKINKMKGGKK